LAFTFTEALPAFGDQLTALAENAYDNAVEAAASAGTAGTQASAASASAASAAASATTALNAPATQATSTSSITVALGSVALTLAQTGKAFAVGQWVSITDTAAPTTRWLAGAITAFNSGTGAMTVSVAVIAGTGSGTSWAVTPSPPVFGTNVISSQVVVVSGTTQTAVAGPIYLLTNAAPTTLTLPASPVLADQVIVIVDNARTDNVIARNGNLIMGLAEDLTINSSTASVTLKYVGGTLGWSLI
jgi:hypothetical protein